MDVSPTKQVFLAIDIGGQGCRCALFSGTGESYYHHQVTYPTQQPGPHQVEHRLDDLLGAIETLLQQACIFLRESPELKLTACGLACQGATLLAWDKLSLEALTPILSWQDTRGFQILEELSIGVQQLHRITGFHASAHYGASKYTWCLKTLEGVRKHREQGQLKMGPLASYLAQKLTGTAEAYCNPSHLARTLLWDYRNGCYSNKLLQAFQMQANELPIPCENSFHHGDIQLPIVCSSVPLTQINRDQAASLFSEGEPDPGCIYINMGTGVFIQRLVNGTYSKEDTKLVRQSRPIPSCGLQLSPYYTDDQQTYFALEASVHSGLAVKTELEEWLRQPLTEALIQTALEQAQDSSTAPWLLLTASGLGSPYWREDITSILDKGLSNQQIIQGWLTGMLYLIRQNVELMDHQLGPATHIIVSGGLGQYAFLCQWLANLCQRPVIRYSDHHATLRGTAYLCAGQPASWQPSAKECFTADSSYESDAHYFTWLKQLYRFLLRSFEPMVAVSHRGDVAHAKENSIEAIDLDIMAGIQHIEFDIQVNAKGEAVLLHDPDLRRIHNLDTSVFELTDLCPGLETLDQLLGELKMQPNTHLFVEIKHDSIDYWGADKVLAAISSLLTTPVRYTLLARSQEFLIKARQSGHVSIGANVRQFTDSEYQKLLQLHPDYLVINHERIPADTRLWPGPWHWMVYEVEDMEHAEQLQQLGASHMISFNARQLHTKASQNA